MFISFPAIIPESVALHSLASSSRNDVLNVSLKIKIEVPVGVLLRVFAWVFCVFLGIASRTPQMFWDKNI